MLFCIFLLLLTEIECFLCMFAGNLREFIYMGISDEKLWESCLKGDKEAFRELYCRFYALLRNYGIKLLQIGRASCRERVEMSVVDGSDKEK